MRRFSVQVPEDLWAGLNDLARRERQDLQPMLRDILQAVVDGDDPGRVVSAGTREAIDALRDEQRGGGAALAQVVREGLESLREGLESLRNEQGRGEAARARVLKEVIESLQTELVRGRAADEAARADLRAALRELQAGVDQVLELHAHPAHNAAKRGLRNPFRGGGG
jgi:uncharacterized protein YicC (UPF0701 family)